MHTEAHRPFTGAPVFITLKAPFRALQTSTIANIMYGGNNPHCRIGEPGILWNPDIVTKTGRRLTDTVFRDHNVRSQPPADYTHKVLFLE